MSPSAISKQLNYSGMSIGRAFDTLIALGLGKDVTHLRERHLCFEQDRRTLFEHALKFLINPMRRIAFVRQSPKISQLKKAGESALADLTDLSGPKIETYAIAARQWKETDLIEVHRVETEIAIELWSYDPSSLSKEATVDPLSLYVQFYQHPDERLALAAESLLERVLW